MRTGHFGAHLARNTVHYAAQFLWFLAIMMIPIAEVVAIEFTGPVWVALLAVVALGERMTATRIAAVILGIVGVLIIVRPGLDHVELGQVVALLAAIGFAGSIILVKSLTRTDRVVSIIFWMSAASRRALVTAGLASSASRLLTAPVVLAVRSSSW